MKTNFNLRQLEKITDGNATALKELLEVFIKESTLQIEQLIFFSNDGNIDSVKNTAHKIKSALTLIGLDEFRPLAEKIEKAGKENSQKIKNDVAVLISVYKQANEDLKLKLKELS